jgi:hypothetical protein
MILITETDALTLEGTKIEARSPDAETFPREIVFSPCGGQLVLIFMGSSLPYNDDVSIWENHQGSFNRYSS